MAKELITPEALEESLAWIDDKLEAEGVNIEAEAERNRRRKIEIYDDFCHVYLEAEQRVVHVPQPTLGFLLLYGERRSYFEDDEHGLGRLLVALRRMKEPGYIRALRMGGVIDDAEADEAMRGVYAEDKLEYYYAIEAAARWGESESEKKTVKLLEQRLGFDSGLMEPLLNSLSSPAGESTTSSTAPTSAPSGT